MNELFAREYEKIEKSLFLVALGYLHNTEDAKDCLQEAVIAAFKAYPKLKNKTYFKTWFTRILINKCKDHLRKRRFTEELDDNAGNFYSLPSEDMEILDAVCALEAKLSVYITLKFYNDMTYDEMARSLKQPVSTVKYRTRQAIEKLRMILEGDE